MTELQQNRYDRLVRRVGNIVSPGAIVADALNELFPVIQVEPYTGELLALMGTRLGIGATQVSAGGGVFPQLQLFNPAGSNTLVTVTRVLVSATANQDLKYNIGNVAFTTLLARGSLRDTRLRTPSANATVAELRVKTTAVPIGAAGRVFFLGSNIFDLSDENDVCVLSPGFGLEFEGTVATFLTANYFWRERTAEPAELNL